MRPVVFARIPHTRNFCSRFKRAQPVSKTTKSPGASTVRRQPPATAQMVHPSTADLAGLPTGRQQKHIPLKCNVHEGTPGRSVKAPASRRLTGPATAGVTPRQIKLKARRF